MNIKQIAFILLSTAPLIINATTPRKIDNTTFLENLPTLKCLCDRITADSVIYNKEPFLNACNILNGYTIENTAVCTIRNSLEEEDVRMQEFIPALQTLGALLSEKEKNLAGEQLIELKKTIFTSVSAIITDEINKLEEMKKEYD
jgi:hypothetical protein